MRMMCRARDRVRRDVPSHFDECIIKVVQLGVSLRYFLYYVRNGGKMSVLLSINPSSLMIGFQSVNRVLSQDKE